MGGAGVGIGFRGDLAGRNVRITWRASGEAKVPRLGERFTQVITADIMQEEVLHHITAR